MTVCSKCGVSFDYKYKKLPRYLVCKMCGDKSQICYNCWCDSEDISNNNRYLFSVAGVCNSCLRDKKIVGLLNGL